MFGACKLDSSVLIEELDYKFVGDCQDGNKLENILNVLRSGEEGSYPDLIRFTEKRLGVVKPSSGMLSISKEEQCNGNTMNPLERSSVLEDMANWQQEIKQVDTSLVDGHNCDESARSLPPVRDATKHPQGSPAQNGREKMEEKLTPDLPQRELESQAVVEKMKGNDAFRSGDYEEALNYYNRSISSYSLLMVHNNRAAVYLKLERYHEALADCRLVLASDATNVKALLRAAISMIAIGEVDAALESLQRLLAIEPSNKRAMELLAQHQNEASDAADVCPAAPEKKASKRLVIEEVDGRSEASHAEPTTNETTSQTDSKRDVTSGSQPVNTISQRTGRRMKIVEVDSMSDVKSSSTTMTTGNPVDASVPAKKDLPLAVVTLKDQGNGHFKAGKYAAAVDAYTHAWNALAGEMACYNTADVAVLLSNRAAAYLKIGKCKECIQDASNSIDLFPTAKALMRRANACEALERYEQSYVDNRAALAMDPLASASQQALSRLGAALRRQHGFSWRDRLPITSIDTTRHMQPSVDKKLSHAKEAAEMSDSFDVVKQKGNELVKQGKFQDAVLCYTRCIQLKASETSAYTNRALCHIKLNKPRLAIDDCTLTLKIDKHNVKAMFRRAQAYKAVKEYKDCLTDLKRLMEIESDNAAANTLYNIAKECYRKDLMSLRAAK